MTSLYFNLAEMMYEDLLNARGLVRMGLEFILWGA